MWFLTIIYAVLILSLGGIYGVWLKKITPVTVFIGMTLAYAVFPLVFEILDYHFFNVVVDGYQLYDLDEFLVGLPYVVVVISILVWLDCQLMKASECLRRRRFATSSVTTRTFAWVCSLLMLASLVLALAGIQVFGVREFLYGYSDASLSHSENMRHSPGWSMYSNGAMFFFAFSVPVLLSVGNRLARRTLISLMVCFSLLNLYGGARLITMTGILAIFFSLNYLSFRLDRKTGLAFLAFVAVFVVVGMLRGRGAVDMLYPFLEFSFVGFGFYNLLSVRDPANVHLLEFLHDTAVFMLPAYVVDKSSTYRQEIVARYLPGPDWLSPIGGNFYLTDFYLYFGLSAPIVFLVFCLGIYFVIRCALRLRVSNFYVAYYSVVVWLLTYGSVWMIRNQLLVVFSMLLKFSVVFALMLVLSATRKVHFYARR